MHSFVFTKIYHILNGMFLQQTGSIRSLYWSPELFRFHTRCYDALQTIVEQHER